MRDKQINFRVNERLYKTIKIAAAMKGVTMNKLIEEAIVRELELQAQQHKK